MVFRPRKFMGLATAGAAVALLSLPSSSHAQSIQHVRSGSVVSDFPATGGELNIWG